MQLHPALIAAITVATGFGLIFVAASHQRLRAKVRQAERAATSAVDEKNRFITLIGHEVRNPLNAIIGMSDLLTQGALSPDQRERAIVIKGCAESLHMVATNLLSLYDSSRTHFVRHDTEIQLRQLAASVRDQLLSAANDKRLGLDIHFEPGSPTHIEADANVLRHVLGNVLTHALGVTDQGHVGVTVHAMSPEDEMLRITVMDTSPMLGRSASTALFAPYGLQDYLPSGHPPGTGLSMFSARSYAELIGGRVNYRNITSGSAYEIALPVRIVDAPADNPSDGASAGVVVSLDLYARHRARLKSKLVLVVEDQRSNQQVINGILQQGGHSVAIAGNGDDALRLLSQESFSAVLIDLRLPKTRGIDVIKLARFTESGRNRETPMIVLTGDLSENSHRACMDAGAAAVLTKPVSAQRLLDTLLAVCERPPQLANAAIGDNAIIEGRIAHEIRTYGVAARISDSLRDALRYTAEIETKAQASDWPAVALRVRAIRGAAYVMGARQVATLCSHITEIVDADMEESWTDLIGELSKRIDEARYAMTSILQAAQEVQQ